MKRTLITLAALVLLPVMPVIAGAAEQHQGHEEHLMPPDSGGHERHLLQQDRDHDAPEKIRTKAYMLGEQTVDGVRCKAMINDTGEAMSQMGMRENYHFMVMCYDAATGAAIEQGMVATKITEPATGQASEPMALMGMGNHFGVDVFLAGKGQYQFQVGTRLADGNNRQFLFSYTVE